MDDRMLDQQIATLLNGDTAVPDAAFVADLRAEIAAEVEGLPRAIDVATGADGRHRRRALPWVLAAAASVAIVAVGAVLVTRDDTSHRLTPAIPTDDSTSDVPATTAVSTTIPGQPPPAPATTPPDPRGVVEISADTPVISPTITKLASIPPTYFGQPGGYVFGRDGSLMVVNARAATVQLLDPSGALVIDALIPTELQLGDIPSNFVPGPDGVLYFGHEAEGLDAWVADSPGTPLRKIAHWDANDACSGNCSDLVIDPSGTRVQPRIGNEPPHGAPFVDPVTGQPSGASVGATPTVWSTDDTSDPAAELNTVHLGSATVNVRIGPHHDGRTGSLGWTAQRDGSALREFSFDRDSDSCCQPYRRLAQLTAAGVVMWDVSLSEIGTFLGGFVVAADGTLRGLLDRHEEGDDDLDYVRLEAPPRPAGATRIEVPTDDRTLDANTVVAASGDRLPVAVRADGSGDVFAVHTAGDAPHDLVLVRTDGTTADLGIDVGLFGGAVSSVTDRLYVWTRTAGGSGGADVLTWRVFDPVGDDRWNPAGDPITSEVSTYWNCTVFSEESGCQSARGAPVVDGDRIDWARAIVIMGHASTFEQRGTVRRTWALDIDPEVLRECVDYCDFVWEIGPDGSLVATFAISDPETHALRTRVYVVRADGTVASAWIDDVSFVVGIVDSQLMMATNSTAGEGVAVLSFDLAPLLI